MLKGNELIDELVERGYQPNEIIYMCLFAGSVVGMCREPQMGYKTLNFLLKDMCKGIEKAIKNAE